MLMDLFLFSDVCMHACMVIFASWMLLAAFLVVVLIVAKELMMMLESEGIA
jgi:hypothetical protein